MSRTPVPAVPMPKARALAKVEQGEQKGEIGWQRLMQTAARSAFVEPWDARVSLFAHFCSPLLETTLKVQMFFCYLDVTLRALMSAFTSFNQLAQNVREGCQRVVRTRA